MIKYLQSILLVLLVTFSGYTQGFIKIIGENNSNDGPTCFIQDGNNFIIGGYANNYSYLKGVDDLGKVLWQKNIDFTDDIDFISDLKVKGNYLFGCGYGHKTGTGGFEEFVFKLDINNLELDWVKRTNLKLKPNNINLLDDGNILVTGDEYANSRFGVFMLKLNAEKGKEIQFETYYFSGNESASDALIHNGTLYTGGRYGLRNKVDKYRGSISNFEISSLEQNWSRYYLNAKNSFSRAYLSNLAIDNENLVASFFTNNFGILGQYTASLALFDLTGSIAWAFEYIPEKYDNITIRDLAILPDGYLLYGFTKSPLKELLLIKTDKNGMLEWAKTYGDYFDDDIAADQGSFMIAKNNFIYLVAQSKNGSTDKSINTLLLKLNLSGEIGNNCWGEEIAIQQKSYLELVEGEIVLSNYDTVLRVNNSSYKDLEIKGSVVNEFLCFPALAQNDYDTVVFGKNDTIQFLRNDQIGVSERVEVAIISTSEYGATTILSDSSFLYSSIKNHCGIDSFQYELTTQNKIKDTATVYVYVAQEISNFNTLNDTVLPENGSIIFSAPASYESYLWSNGNTNNEVIISLPGLYSFYGKKNDCIYQKSFIVKENLFSFNNVAANNLVLLLDVSLSMNMKNRLPLLKQSLYKILGYMRSIDQLSIISYSNDADIIFDGIEATEIEKIQQKIDSLTSNGQSNLIGGMELGFKTVKKNFNNNGNNRIILATDGDISNDKRASLQKLLEKSLEENTFFTIFLFNNSTLFINQLQELTNSFPNAQLVVVDETNIDEALIYELKAIRN